LSSAPSSPPKLSAAAQRALLIVFVVITVVDVLSFRSLFVTVAADEEVVHKAVFERDAGNVVARAVPWHYPMVPHPVAYDVRTVQLPPGYPILLNTGGDDSIDALDVRIYEQPAVALIMVRPAGGATFFAATVDEAGQATLAEVRTEAPTVAASAAVTACFDGDAAGTDRVFQLKHTGGSWTLAAGRCRWTLPTEAAEVLVTSQASARVEMSGERDVGDRSFELLVFLLVVFGSLLSRWALQGVAFFLTDAVATFFVFAVSFFSPMWLLLWGLKAAAGAAVLGWRGLQLVRRSRKGQMIAGGAAAVAVLVVVVVDPVEAAAWYTDLMADMQIAAMEAEDDREEAPIDSASHLVLGYSTVNAAAAGRGAYGSAALDRVLQRTCGDGRTFARHGTDGANICLMAETWNEVSRAHPGLQQRVFVGGFNDDIAPSLRSLRTVIPSFLALIPAADPFPSVEAAWAETANANVNVQSNVDRALGCIGAVASEGGPSGFTYVYDLGIFDLGRARGYGRDQWVTYRRQAVEAAGGRFVDLRDLLPGESLAYFNDFVHPSEVGYELMAEALCDQMGAPPPGAPAPAP
jgi:hypothetical protein